MEPMTDDLTAGDPPPIAGVITMRDGTTQPTQAVYFGLDADGHSVYRALGAAPIDMVHSAHFDMLPARSRIELLLHVPGSSDG